MKKNLKIISLSLATMAFFSTAAFAKAASNPIGADEVNKNTAANYKQKGDKNEKTSVNVDMEKNGDKTKATVKKKYKKTTKETKHQEKESD